MTKKIFIFLLIASIIYLPLNSTTTVQAAENESVQNIIDVEYLGDSYIETTLETHSPSIALFATTKNTSATKTISQKTSSGSVLWSFKITASFTYNGTTSSCTSASYSYTDSSAWSLSNMSISRSGNTATGKVTAREKFLGITIYTAERTLTLKCSASGTVS